ncbi:hypothetical protein EC991_010566 [Linnemannia zychae]|nr:hypothetical protein EC991_010566 [Linnemannia zychae]
MPALGRGYYGGQLSAFSCPEWVPAPDPRVCLLIPFPPMTNLTHLTVQIGLDYIEDGFEGETLIDRYETNNHVAQVAWIVHLNPNLVQVCISGIVMEDLDAVYALAWSVSSLKKLEKLILEFLGKEGLWTMLSLAFWLTCPRSLKGLGLLFDYADDDDDQEEETNTTHADLKKIASWGLQRRQGPLDNLNFMTVENITYLATSQVCELFQSCPSLTHLNLPHLAPDVDVVQLGRAIARSCTKLTDLIRQGNADDRRQVLVFEILESMVVVPALKKFVSLGSFPVTDRMMAVFGRHTTTLTWVEFDSNEAMESRFVQLVLFECPLLERFVLRSGTVGTTTTKPNLTVAQAVERKWASSQIKRLSLRISLGDLAVITDTAEPYYRRPAPIVLTDQERQRFAVLEKFYMQLGALTKLEMLALWRVEPSLTTNNNNNDDDDDNDDSLAFPGLLGLADPSTGRPGFLELLSGLKKLTSLCGSFGCSKGENKAIVGMNEVRWIARSWPALREVDFWPEPLFGEENISPCFEWLQKERPELLLS